ncbi:ABC transporter ATP-binding protein [Nocardiopsis sp. FIRDI 009]|uniref:ABC transporter ATP-binding protein n=1 Tax=Nocardiopsis sp. FIRDI 009 TaxID=714197 RepID=UPI000E23897B|nr:ATP-binding cassette domain-containing protein [Nocardiopsis sp. FIRDI 009]
MSGEYAASFRSVSKRFGSTTAVDDITFDVRPGRITGLLGRNGAGKTTSLKMLLGLARPTEGTTTVFGRPYASLPDAAHRVGVGMDGVNSIPDMRGRRELRVWSRMLGLPDRRVDEVLELVGLGDRAERRVKDYSTGMRQRHTIAGALLADPEFLVLDEPVNGLDPDGIRWLRGFLRRLADEGRTVLISSHLLAEVEQTVDDVVVIQKSLRYSGPLSGLVSGPDERLEERFFSLVGSENEKEKVSA